MFSIYTCTVVPGLFTFTLLAMWQPPAALLETTQSLCTRTISPKPIERSLEILESAIKRIHVAKKNS